MNGIPSRHPFRSRLFRISSLLQTSTQSPTFNFFFIFIPRSSLPRYSCSAHAINVPNSPWKLEAESTSRRLSIAISIWTDRMQDVVASHFAKCPLVGSEKVLDGMFPRQLILHSSPTELTHPRSFLGMIQQPEYLGGEIRYRVSPVAVQGRFLGAEPTLSAFELHNGLAQRHVFHNFVHGRDTIHLTRFVRINAHVCCRENLYEI